MAYTYLFYHCIIFTKYHHPVLKGNCLPLYNVIEKKLQNLRCAPFAVNGSDNHIHIAMEAQSLISVDDIVEEIWQVSAEWIENTRAFPMFTQWEKNYVVWSLAQEEIGKIIREIQNQKRLHNSCTLSMELRKMGVDL